MSTVRATSTVGGVPCLGEAGSNRCASCVLLRLLTIGNTWPTPNTSTFHTRMASEPAQLFTERPRPQPRCSQLPSLAPVPRRVRPATPIADRDARTTVLISDMRRLTPGYFTRARRMTNTVRYRGFLFTVGIRFLYHCVLRYTDMLARPAGRPDRTQDGTGSV